MAIYNLNAYHNTITSNVTMDVQTAIPTLNRNYMQALLHSQLLVYGLHSTIYTTIYKGVPLYLLQCNNIGYVCTKAQAHYLLMHYCALRTITIDYVHNSSIFRVYPLLQNLPHKSKGAQYGVVYTDIGKNRTTSGNYDHYYGVLPL